jgi:hypothetical protein
MVLIFQAALYVIALGLSLVVITSLADGSPRRMRVARAALAGGGGGAIAVAIALTFMGRWVESTAAGCVAIVIVSSCMWYALTSRAPVQDDDDDDDDGDGGSKRPPPPPAPQEPTDGPSLHDWWEFDRARADWERRPDPVGVE